MPLVESRGKTAVRNGRRAMRLKDEVYRQMFLLEERRPGAAMGLALALLRAWLEVDSRPASHEERDWLKKVSPICLDMIETTLHAPGTAPSAN